MSQIRFYFDKRRPSKSGKYPIRIAISNNGTSYISLEENISEDEWCNLENVMHNKPAGRKSDTTKYLLSKFKEVEGAFFMIKSQMPIATMKSIELRDRIVALMSGEIYDTRLHQKKRGSFIKHFNMFGESRRSKGTQEIYACTLSKLRSFNPSVDVISFEDIDTQWLNAFVAYCRNTGSSANTIHQHLRNIRAVFNDAIRCDKTEFYPFKKFRMPKLEETKKRSLELEDLRIIRDYPLPYGYYAEYRDMFMLSFYLIGINMTDLLSARHEDLVKGRLEYRRQKTGRLYSIKVEPEAQKLIDMYAGENQLLSPLDRVAAVDTYLQHMNNALGHIGQTFHKGIGYEGKPLFPGLTSYYARHSWATAASKLGIPMDTIGRALGHSWVEKSVTSIYIKYDNTKVDEANRLVLDELAGEK